MKYHEMFGPRVLYRPNPTIFLAHLHDSMFQQDPSHALRRAFNNSTLNKTAHK